MPQYGQGRGSVTFVFFIGSSVLKKLNSKKVFHFGSYLLFKLVHTVTVYIHLILRTPFAFFADLLTVLILLKSDPAALWAGLGAVAETSSPTLRSRLALSFAAELPGLSVDHMSNERIFILDALVNVVAFLFHAPVIEPKLPLIDAVLTMDYRLCINSRNLAYRIAQQFNERRFA